MAKKKTSRFRGKVNRNVEKQKANASSFGYLKIPQGVDLFKVEPDTRVKFDIIPYIVSDETHMDRDDDFEVAVPGELWYKKPFKIHRNVGPDNESIVCPTTFGKKCPICEYKAKLAREGAPREETDPLRTTLRNLYYVVPIGSKEHEEKIHLWEFSQGNFQKLLNKELAEDEDYEVFPDLEEGMTLKVRFDEETFLKNKFAKASRIDFLEREEAYAEDFADELTSLDEMLKVLSYKEIERMFFEFEAPEDEDEDEETRTFKEVDDEDDEEEDKPKRKPARKPKPKPEPEPEEEEEEDEEEEDKPKRKPARKAKTKSKTTEEECPEGFEFGVDTEMYDECEDCDLFDACMEAKENA
jgi:hypothetical protein